MSGARAIQIVCAAAAALGVACSTSQVGSALRAGAASEPSIVRFDYQAVNPEVVRIPASGNVAWQNAADDAWALVVFPASIASSFGCQDLRPYLIRSADVYRSQPLANGVSERAQLPCSLAPGSYDYEIWLMGSGFGGEVDSNRPEKILRGKIVVE